MARKILLLEMTGPNVTTYTPLAFNPADKGANIALSNNNFTAAASASRGVIVRASGGKTTGKWYFEYHIDSIATALYVGVGVARSTATLAQGVGVTADSWGYYNDGNMYTNNVASGGNPFYASGSTIGVALDIDNGKIWFSWNGNWLGDPSRGLSPQYTGLTGTLHPAASPADYINAGDKGQITLVSDPGKQAYATPVGFTAGWQSSATVAGSNYYFGSEGFITSSGDVPASTYYDARIKPDGDPVYERSVSCAIWGRGTQNPAIGDIELINTDGALDTLLLTQMRDATVTLKLGYYGQSYSSFVTVGKAVVDQLTEKDEHTLKIGLRGKLAQLSKPLQSNLYDATAPNTTLEGYPIPIMLGACQWVPIVTYDPPYLEYQTNDGPFGEVGELRDQGVAITKFTGWDCGSEANNYGVRRLTNPAGRMCVIQNGTINLGSIFLNEGFNAWAADDPVNWTVTGPETGTAKVTQNGSAARFIGDAVTTVRAVYNQANLTSAVIYFAQIIVSSYTSGYIWFGHGGTNRAKLTKAGTYNVAFKSIGNAAVFLKTDIAAGNTDLTIDNVKIWATTAIDRLPAWLTYLCVTRGGLSGGDLDTAGTITALDTASPYYLNYYTQQNVLISDILLATMDSFCGWLWEHRLGLIKAGQLVGPSSTPDLYLTDTELTGDITVELDTADGLSNTVLGTQNYSVHTASDIAGSEFVSEPQISANLQLPYLSKKKGYGSLATCYSKAVSHDPMPTLLTYAAQVQVEANRRVGLFPNQRNFYTFSALIDDTTSYTLEPGQTVNVTTTIHQRFQLVNKNLLVISVKSRFLKNLVEIKAWG